MEHVGKSFVYPAIIDGKPVIKKPISPLGLPNNGGVTLFEFKDALQLVQFLAKHDDIFSYSSIEMKQFLKQNL